MWLRRDAATMSKHAVRHIERGSEVKVGSAALRCARTLFEMTRRVRIHRNHKRSVEWKDGYHILDTLRDGMVRSLTVVFQGQTQTLKLKSGESRGLTAAFKP